jgi:hypothetical protein
MTAAPAMMMASAIARWCQSRARCAPIQTTAPFPSPATTPAATKGARWDSAFALNALNHFDFRANWQRESGAAQIPQINTIHTQNSVIGGDLF